VLSFDVIGKVLGSLMHEKSGKGLLKLLIFRVEDELFYDSNKLSKRCELDNECSVIIEKLEEVDKIVLSSFAFSEDKALKFRVSIWMGNEGSINLKILLFCGLLLFHR
jgi:hypothetical protein